MNFKLGFTTGLPDVEYDFNMYELTPVELRVTNGGKRTKGNTLYAVAKTMRYAFTGLPYRVTGRIEHLSIGKSWSGTIKKWGDSVEWGLIQPLVEVVLYDVTAAEITETMCIAQRIVCKKHEIVADWASDLHKFTQAELRSKYVSAIEAFAEFIPNYSLRWESGKLNLYNKDDKRTSRDNVAELDVCCLLKLLSILFTKGKHLGVFFIDCSGLRDCVIDAMMYFIKAVYGDTFVFLTNCSIDSRVKREVISLPNIYLDSN